MSNSTVESRRHVEYMAQRVDCWPGKFRIQREVDKGVSTTARPCNLELAISSGPPHAKGEQ